MIHFDNKTIAKEIIKSRRSDIVRRPYWKLLYICTRRTKLKHTEKRQATRRRREKKTSTHEETSEKKIRHTDGVNERPNENYGRDKRIYHNFNTNNCFSLGWNWCCVETCLSLEVLFDFSASIALKMNENEWISLMTCWCCLILDQIWGCCCFLSIFLHFFFYVCLSLYFRLLHRVVKIHEHSLCVYDMKRKEHKV